MARYTKGGSSGSKGNTSTNTAKKSGTTTKKAKLGTGARFAKLKGEVAKGYTKKGISAKKAEKIGAAVAAIKGREKYGKAKMAKWSAQGRKRAAK